ncbi:MAG: trimethylamine methyltransferase family protein, partial [Dehalobacterium sp.]
MERFLPLRLLTAEQMEKIHQKSLKILWEIGVNVDEPEARKILLDHGCKSKGRRVYIPEDLVEKVIRRGESTKKKHVIYSRTGQMVQTEKGKTYIHNGGAVATLTDLRTGKQRPANLKDCADLAKLMDTLEYIHGVTPIVYPQEVDQRAALLYAVWETIKNTSKPVSGPGVSSLIEAKYIHEMFVALAGDEETLKEKPMYDLGFSPLSPLTFSKGDTEAIIWAARKGIAIAALPCPIAGMTAPLTILGALTQQNAEILAVVTLISLIDPSLPVSYSARLDHADFRYGNTVGGAPESGIVGACAVQLADYYGLNSNVYGAGTNAVLGDPQLGLEKAMNIIFPALV